MQIIHDTNRVTVTNLSAAYTEAKTFIGYDGNDNYKMFWLLSYYQLKVLNGYVADNKKAIERFSNASTKVANEFDSNFNDSRYRGICFVGGGNLSKGSYNYKMRMREKTGRLAEKTCLNKIFTALLDFTNTNQNFNGSKMIEIVSEFDRNKYISDLFDYSIQWNTPLTEVHQKTLLFLNKYAPKYITDCIGYYLGKYWAKN